MKEREMKTSGLAPAVEVCLGNQFPEGRDVPVPRLTHSLVPQH